MKKALLLVSLLTTTLPALAGPCAALDYQEMKDMSAEQLTKVACDYREKMSESMDESMSNLNVSRGARPFPNANENFDQCSGQIDRVDRVLESKGMSKDVIMQTCRGQAADRKAAIDRLLKR